MNLKQRDTRLLHADHIRERALHDMNRLRAVVQRIAELAEPPVVPGALAEIACLARNALIASAPPDPDHSHDTDHS